MLLSPIIGGLLVGLLTVAFSQENALVKVIQAAITLGSGASLGPEGPSVKIGLENSKVFQRVFGLKSKEFFKGAGVGAAIAAGFNAPMSGVFFAVETVLLSQKANQKQQTSNKQQIVVVLLACVTAAIISQIGLGSEPAFSVPQYDLRSYLELPLYLVLGVLCGLISLLVDWIIVNVTNVLYIIQMRGNNQEVLAFFPGVGGLISGILAYCFPEISYKGFDNVNLLLQSGGQQYSIEVLLQLVVVKVVASSACRAFGLVGGLYAPSIFIGVALGSAFGQMTQYVVQFAGSSGAYALVGCGAMLGGICRVPLTAIVLLFELTRDYNIVLPSIGALGIAFWTTSLPTWIQTQTQPVATVSKQSEDIFLFLKDDQLDQLKNGEEINIELVDKVGGKLQSVKIKKLE